MERTTGTAAPAQRRPPGRPREARCDEAIIAATLEMLAEGGVGALTMEAVAGRAGVGKATLYRRWPGKESLVVDALATLTEDVLPATTGTLRTDLLNIVETLRRRDTHTIAGRIFPRLIAEYQDTPAVLDLYRHRVMDPLRSRIGEVLARGAADGVLRPEVDVDITTDMLIGPMLYRSLMRGRGPVTPTEMETVVDTVLGGLRALPVAAGT